MFYEYSGIWQENLGSPMSCTVNFFPTGLVHIAIYVFTGFALYTIASRREIKKPWLAWIPIVNVWTIGSLSDQYRYVVKGEIRSKRKSLLVLSVVEAVIALAAVVGIIVMLVNAFMGVSRHFTERQFMEQMMKPFVFMLLTLVPLIGVSIAHTIIYYMALYDVYTSCDRKNNVVYLVLSIIPGVSTIAMPLFLFLCRDKDEGMPPRRQAEPVFAAEESVFVPEEPPVWEAPKEEEPWQDTENE